MIMREEKLHAGKSEFFWCGLIIKCASIRVLVSLTLKVIVLGVNRSRISGLQIIMMFICDSIHNNCAAEVL